MATPGYAQMLQSTMPTGTETTYSPQVQQSGYQQAVERARRRRMGRAGRMTGGQILRNLGGQQAIIRQGADNVTPGMTFAKQEARDILLKDPEKKLSLIEFGDTIRGRFNKQNQTYSDYVLRGGRVRTSKTSRTSMIKKYGEDADFIKLFQEGNIKRTRFNRDATKDKFSFSGQRFKKEANVLMNRYKQYLIDYDKKLKERANKISQIN